MKNKDGKKKNVNEKVQKNYVKFGVGKKICCPFFKCLLNFRPLALQSKLNKVNISNFVKFLLQSMSFKIEQTFEERTFFPIKIGQKIYLLGN